MTGDENGESARHRPIVRRSVDREVEDELAFHLAMRARDLASVGHGAGAEQAAEAEFGDIDRVKRELRHIAHRRDGGHRRTRFFSELARDVQFAVRRLLRRPAFAALSIGTIALGVGAATGIFSVVDGVLLRALPFKDPSRLMAIWITQPTLAKDPVLSRYAESSVFGSTEYFALRDRNTAFEQVAAWTQGSYMLAGPAGNDEVQVLATTASMLPLLGVQPVLGRGFHTGENVFHGSKVALVSWEAWQTRFGGDSAVLGKHVTLDEETYEIVGVVPRGVRVDRANEPPPFWVPALQGEYDLPERHNRSFRVVGRLKPGVTIAAAQSEAAHLVRDASADTTAGIRVENWQHDQTKDARSPLLVILAASGLLLLIGCVNVAMLTLGDAATRDREIAARMALGAGRFRVVRQLLAESMTIAIAGAAGGTAIAWGLTRTLVSLAPTKLPGLDDARLDWRILLFAICCAALSGVLFGLAPAWSMVRGADATLTRAGSGQSSRNSRPVQRALIAAEISLSLVLLVGAALLTQSLSQLSAVDPGFHPSDLTVVRLTAPNAFYRDGDRLLAYYQEAARHLRAVTGVDGVTAGAQVPFSGGSSSSPVAVEGREYTKGNPPPHTEQHAVLQGYFELLNIPLREGRTFNDGDTKGAELVAVISVAAAHRDFPGESALGRLVRYQGKVRRIVGIVGDVRVTRLGRVGAPTIYVPLPQLPEGNVSFVIRSRGDIASAAPAIRAALREVDQTVVVRSVERLPRLVEKSYGEERYRTTIVSVFAILAGALAVIGLYGVTLRAVARRQREVGIRIALGATPGNVTWLMMSDTIVGVIAGVVIGVPLSIIAGNQLAPFLFQVGPRDPAAIGSVLLLLAVVALVASGLPARRAARSNPATVLTGD
jgi:predicted permease